MRQWLFTYLKTSPLTLWVLGLLLSLPTLTPLFQDGFFPIHDYTHVARLAEMSRALEDGHFPVRWSQNLGYGYGMPQFNFYAPLFYYIAWVFVYTGFSYLAAIKITLALLTIAGFWAMYKTALILFRQPAYGLLAGLLFVYAPYRAVDLYVRGAFGELLAITAVAFVLMTMTAYARYRSWGWLLSVAMSISALVLSHNLVAFIALPLMAVYFGGIVLIPRKESGKHLIRAALSILLGVAGAAFYILPAFFEKDYTRVADLTGGFSDFHHHFLYLRQLWQSAWGYGGSIYGLDDGMSFEVGKITLVMTMAGLLALWVRRREINKQVTLTIILLVALAAISMLMTTFKTLWLWEAVPLFAFIQFPWRYLSLTIVLLPLAASASLYWLPKNNYLAAKIIPLIISILIIGLNSWRFTPDTYLNPADGLYYDDPARISSHMSDVIPDFLPQFGRSVPKVPPANRVEVYPSEVMSVLEINRTHEFLARLRPHTGAQMMISIFYYPGWTLFVDGEVRLPDVDPETGTMMIILKPTEQESIVSGKFMDTPLRQTATTLSLITWIGMVGFMIFKQPKKGLA
jgi:hypothetical protein